MVLALTVSSELVEDPRFFWCWLSLTTLSSTIGNRSCLAPSEGLRAWPCLLKMAGWGLGWKYSVLVLHFIGNEVQETCLVILVCLQKSIEMACHWKRPNTFTNGVQSLLMLHVSAYLPFFLSTIVPWSIKVWLILKFGKCADFKIIDKTRKWQCTSSEIIIVQVLDNVNLYVSRFRQKCDVRFVLKDFFLVFDTIYHVLNLIHVTYLYTICAVCHLRYIFHTCTLSNQIQHWAQTTVCALILIIYLCTIYAVTPIWIGDMDPYLTGRIVVTIGELARRKRGRGPVRGSGLGSGSLSTSRPIGCGWTAVNSCNKL